MSHDPNLRQTRRCAAILACGLAVVLSVACSHSERDRSELSAAMQETQPAERNTIWSISHFSQSLRRVDGETGPDYPPVNLPGKPAGVVAANGRVWVVLDGGDLLQIDGSTKEILSTTTIGSQPTAICAAFGAIWVADNEGTGQEKRPVVVRVDPEDITSHETIAVGDASDQLGAIAASEEGVWVLVTNGLEVARIDPTTNRVAETLPLGRNGGYGWGELAVGSGRLWVADQYGDTLDVLSTSPLELLSSSAIGATWDGELAVGAGTVFLVDRDASEIHLLDAQDGSPLSTTIHTPDRPGALSFDGGRLYVSIESLNGPLGVFDPSTGEQLDQINGVHANHFTFEGSAL